MINFRFHLVSLIAVFLALALGIVVGSTVIDRAIVDGLEAQIDRVERNADAQRAENDELRRQLDELQALSDQMAPFTVRGDRLLDVPIVVFAVRGADEGAVGAVVEAVRAEGALAPVVLWIEAKWELSESVDRDAMAELVGETRGGASDLRAAALEQLSARVAAGGATGVSDNSLASPDVLQALIERGFLVADPAGAADFAPATFPGAGARVLLVSGADDDVAAETVVVPLARSLADSGLLTLVAGPDESPSQDTPRSAVEAIRSDGALADRVSTVDDAESAAGRIAISLGLEELGRGGHGHYGVGSGASRRLPNPAGA